MTKTIIGVPEGGKKYKAELDSTRNDPRSEIVGNADRAINKIGAGTKVKVQATGGHRGRKQTATWF
jgi:hypothetical protein